MDHDKLNVWYEDCLVGSVYENEVQKLIFEYSPEWLTSERKFSLSHSMPLNTYTPAEKEYALASHNFFTNLLPEGHSKARIEKELKVSGDFQLLKAIGGECAGALSVSEKKPSSCYEYEEIDNDELDELLNTRSLYFKDDKKGRKQRFSLAGVQDKTVVYYQGDKILLPVDDAPSTHILKYKSHQFRNLPALETIATWTAKNLDIPVVDVQYMGHNDNDFILVERYDRTFSDHKIKRLHQEDFSQALSIFGDNKYEQYSGKGFKDCIQLVQTVSDNVRQDMKKLIQWHVFNFFIGNSDAHMKNLSFIYHDNTQRSLAPFYDLVPVQAYQGDIDHSLSMYFGGAAHPYEISSESLEIISKECKARPAYIVKIAEQIKNNIMDAFNKAVDEFEDNHRVCFCFDRVERVIKKNIEHYNKSL